MDFEYHALFMYPGDGGVAVEMHTNDLNVLRALVFTLPSWVVVTLDDLAECDKKAAVREAKRIMAV